MHSIQGGRATIKQEKQDGSDEKHIGNLITKSPKINRANYL